jgi:hypothetical protein
VDDQLRPPSNLQVRSAMRRVAGGLRSINHRGRAVIAATSAAFLADVQCDWDAVASCLAPTRRRITVVVVVVLVACVLGLDSTPMLRLVAVTVAALGAVEMPQPVAGVRGRLLRPTLRSTR